jgi:hypothetical protein
MPATSHQLHQPMSCRRCVHTAKQERITAGTFPMFRNYHERRREPEEDVMNGLIYLVGLIVVILAVLSFFGLR